MTAKRGRWIPRCLIRGIVFNFFEDFKELFFKKLLERGYGGSPKKT